MAVPFAEITGPSYFYQDKFAAIERSVNWYLNANESSGERKFTTSLATSPGNKSFSTLPVPAPCNQWSRALIEYRGTAYGVNGSVAFYIDGGGTYTRIGDVSDDGKPASMAGNSANQIFIASGGLGYVINTIAKTLTAVPVDSSAFLGANFVTFQDGYIISVVPPTATLPNQMQISGSRADPLNNATLWDSLNVSIQTGQSDELRAVISRSEYLHLFGSRRSQIFNNQGTGGIGNFPFQNYNQTYIETGIAAAFSLADLGDSLVWIGEDQRGIRAAWRNAYGSRSPDRISTFAVERAWRQYLRIDNARAYPLILSGHLQWVISFPNAFRSLSGDDVGATWVYDATVSQILGKPIWSERNFTRWDGFQTCRSEQTHCYCYNKHLVGSVGLDGNPGAIYEADENTFTDCGLGVDGAQTALPIVRDRITPHIWNGSNYRMPINRLQLECMRGVGLNGVLGDPGTMPQMLLRFSKDGGNNWSQEFNASVGRAGDYCIRVMWNRLGMARDWVFWLRYAEPTPMEIINGSFEGYVSGA